MKKSNLFIASAVAAALTMPFVSLAQGGPAPKPKFEAQKCYGVAKAGKNDCQTANSSCAGIHACRRVRAPGGRQPSAQAGLRSSWNTEPVA